MLPRPVVVGLTILISLVWAGNVVVGFINPDLRDPMINAIFAIVVGSLYALGRKGNGNGARDITDAITKATGKRPPSRQDPKDGEP